MSAPRTGFLAPAAASAALHHVPATRRSGAACALAALLALIASPLRAEVSATPAAQFVVSVDPSLASTGLEGRLFVFISAQAQGEPRLFDSSVWIANEPHSQGPVPLLFGADVEYAPDRHSATLDSTAKGYPLASLTDLPPGDYTVQAVLAPYTRYARADGHVIWAHQDQGEGQDVLSAPGNLVSRPVRVRLDARAGFNVPLRLDHVIPAIPPEADSPLVKYQRFVSALASKFWGHDMAVGITVALPRSYAEHPERRYPVVFHQGHFGEGAVFSLLTPPSSMREGTQLQQWSSSVRGFREDWNAGRTPQVIVVTLQHATPYYDTSYFMNSQNVGPWADVFTREVIPFIDSRYRTLAKPYARVLAGLSSGGGISAYLQAHYPGTFGGAWSFAPDPVDLRDFYTVDLYRDENAYFPNGYQWGTAPARCEFRSTQGQCLQTMQGLIRYFDVLGSHGRSGQWMDNYDAMYGPVGADGYPLPVWDHASGKIDRQVVAYWHDHGADLRAYLEAGAGTLAPALRGKLHFAAGEMDNFFLNNGLYLLEQFLAQTPPYSGVEAEFRYGRPKVGHSFVGVGYDPFPQALLRDIAAYIARHAPPEDRSLPWKGH